MQAIYTQFGVYDEAQDALVVDMKQPEIIDYLFSCEETNIPASLPSSATIDYLREHHMVIPTQIPSYP